MNESSDRLSRNEHKTTGPEPENDIMLSINSLRKKTEMGHRLLILKFINIKLAARPIGSYLALCY